MAAAEADGDDDFWALSRASHDLRALSDHGGGAGGSDGELRRLREFVDAHFAVEEATRGVRRPERRVGRKAVEVPPQEADAILQVSAPGSHVAMAASESTLGAVFGIGRAFDGARFDIVGPIIETPTDDLIRLFKLLLRVRRLGLIRIVLGLGILGIVVLVLSEIGVEVLLRAIEAELIKRRVPVPDANPFPAPLPNPWPKPEKEPTTDRKPREYYGFCVCCMDLKQAAYAEGPDAKHYHFRVETRVPCKHPAVCVDDCVDIMDTLQSFATLIYYNELVHDFTAAEFEQRLERPGTYVAVREHGSTLTTGSVEIYAADYYGWDDDGPTEREGRPRVEPTPPKPIACEDPP